MSTFVSTAPEVLAAASTDLNKIGEALRSAGTSAAPATSSIVPAAADEGVGGHYAVV